VPADDGVWCDHDQVSPPVAYVTDPGVIGISPIFRASDDVPGGFVDAVCGPGR
jgi:hypothetical protein